MLASNNQISFEPGFKGIIDHFSSDEIARKLMSMGVLPGESIELIRKAPFGGGWYIKVGQRRLALRKQELVCIKMK